MQSLRIQACEALVSHLHS